MDQNDMSISAYKAGATMLLDASRIYFTCMERLREVQRRTSAECAQAAERYAATLKDAGDLAQCASWQQQAYAEQIGRWNQYAMELVQVASEGQALTQVALRESMAQAQKAYGSLVTHMPAMPYAFPMADETAPTPAPRKPNSLRAGAH